MNVDCIGIHSLKYSLQGIELRELCCIRIGRYNTRSYQQYIEVIESLCVPLCVVGIMYVRNAVLSLSSSVSEFDVPVKLRNTAFKPDINNKLSITERGGYRSGSKSQEVTILLCIN